MLNEFFLWLEYLPLAQHIGATWWFPLMESLHVVSMTLMHACRESSFADQDVVDGIRSYQYCHFSLLRVSRRCELGCRKSRSIFGALQCRLFAWTLGRCLSGGALDWAHSLACASAAILTLNKGYE